jgi:hypothetical protein
MRCLLTLLCALKKAEPLGFLASLSLVISTFTFGGEGNIYRIYSYSVVSAFMFIFSFVSSIFNQYLKSVESNNPIINIMQAVTNFGIYFFSYRPHILDTYCNSVWTITTSDFNYNGILSRVFHLYYVDLGFPREIEKSH